MAKLDAAQRKALPSKDFAGSGRSYPIPDKSHAEQALRMEGHASPEEQKKITAKVQSKFPGVGKSDDKKDTPMGKMVRGALSKR